MTSRPERWLLKVPGLWLAFPTDPAEVDDILRRCLTMIRASGADRLEIEIVPLRWRVVRIRFRGEQRHRKARLLKSLIAKQFRGILPRLRIRLT